MIQRKNIEEKYEMEANANKPSIEEHPDANTKPLKNPTERKSDETKPLETEKKKKGYQTPLSKTRAEAVKQVLSDPPFPL